MCLILFLVLGVVNTAIKDPPVHYSSKEKKHLYSISYSLLYSLFIFPVTLSFTNTQLFQKARKIDFFLFLKAIPCIYINSYKSLYSFPMS
ncbi:hypothetical protein AB4K20DRAFT_1896581 [Rhizopus microsporus]